MSPKTGKPSYTKAPPRTRPSASTLVFTMLLPVVLAAFVGAGIGYAVGRPSGTDQAVSELRAAEVRRDAEQIVKLTTDARATRDALAPVLSELDTALKAGQPLSADKVAGWQQIARDAVRRHEESPSGTTLTNVARGGLRGAVNQLALALDTCAAAAALPADAQRTLLDLAGRQRTVATTAWSVAAAQLDQINIDAGHGHQHVYLETEPGSGAFTSDGSAEGTDG